MATPVSKHCWFMILVAGALLLVGMTVRVLAQAPDADNDGLPDKTEKWLGSPIDRPQVWTQFWSRDPKEAEGKPGPQVLRLSAVHVAEDRYLWKADFLEPFPTGGATFILYVDSDNRPDTGRQDKPSVQGTDLMYILSGAAKNINAFDAALQKPQSDIRIEAVGSSLVISHDTLMNQSGGKVVIRVRLLAQAEEGSSGSDWIQVELPLMQGQKKPPTIGPGDPEFLGVSGEKVRKSMSGPYPDRRPQPSVPFIVKPRKPGKAGSAKCERTPVELAEEHGIARVGAPVTFGFPLAEGALFDPANARLLDPSGREIPAQFTITNFWKDDSIRWMAVTFLADLAAKSRPVYTVEFGSDVRPADLKATVRMATDAEGMTIHTGPMQARLGFGEGGVLRCVWVDRNGDGAFTDEGKILDRTAAKHDDLEGATRAAVVQIVEQGPLSLLLRVEGPYAGSDFRYVMWLRFHAGSTIVDVAHRHIDASLDHEFADFRSLAIPLPLNLRGAAAEILLPDDKGGLKSQGISLGKGQDVRLFQRDDNAFVLTGPARSEGKRAPGVLALRDEIGRGVGVAVEDFWQNYPSALRASTDRIEIELWPDISKETAYAQLPEYVSFPYVGGGYRFKWGMSKTHRFRIDFGLKPGQPMAPAEPVVAVIPSAYYEKTKALGPMVAQRKGEFEAWDGAMARCFTAHMEIKEKVREYGFFNWGDWYGERGSNWGNHEYDLPHAIFMHFARTGDRDLFRVALAGARHQADVDIVHAYPDPAYIGGDVLHSAFHTGQWSENIKDRSWSAAYAYHVMAFNGHTWSEGMCDAWHLTADAPVMESAQLLGEHIVYGMVPRFKDLGTHERSAGWSLVAVMALHRATLDPLYLDAAKKIAEVAFRERKPGQGSGWPHDLPRGHCRHLDSPGGKPCVGNVVFLIGILCSGLEQYYLETGDERAKEAIIGVGPWWKTMWTPEDGTFQYTDCPLFRGNTSPLTAMLCVDALAFTYEHTKDMDFANMVGEAFLANMALPPGGHGKAFSMFARCAPNVMAFLKEAQSKCAPARMALTATDDDILVRRLARAKPTEFIGVRGPEAKRFFVSFDGGRPETITIERKTHGARPKDKMKGAVTITDPGGNPVKSETFDTDLPCKLDVALPFDASKGVYTVAISDDMRGIWHVASTGGKVVLDCSEGPSLAEYRSRRVFFFVPDGAKTFRIAIAPVHDGTYGMCVFDADGKPIGHMTGTKTNEAAEGWVDVKVIPGQGGKVWSAVVFAAGNLCIKMEGVPPYISTSAEGWFDPKRP
ncbi:MAG: hypothetical protein AB1696_06870 [Planctomycetota bacterium]